MAGHLEVLLGSGRLVFLIPSRSDPKVADPLINAFLLDCPSNSEPAMGQEVLPLFRGKVFSSRWA